jgi:septum formation protein
MERILLASGSPRRRELLEAAGIPFELFVPSIDETRRDSLRPPERVIALATDKARAASALAPPGGPRLVLGADTLVCVPGGGAGREELALGKPEGEEDARRMLGLLAGRAHVVRTGLALLDSASGEVFAFRSDSTVSFSPMSEAEIEGCLAAGEWEGVAGAYRIQGLAALFIDRLEGSWTGVVGLPMQGLYVILQQAGCRFPFARTGSS